MKWQGRRGSSNVEDRRGSSMGTRGGLGCGGIIIILLISWLLGINPLQLFQASSGVTNVTQQEQPYEATAEEDELAQFVKVVLADTEDVWGKVFSEKYGEDYPEPTLVLFNGQVQSGCGFAGAATGPFYCPLDQKVYIDLSFYNDLQNRFGAPGDFAMAYVIAHEVGHHVQNLLGYTDKVHSQRNNLSEAEYNKLSVKLELQADFLAGFWARRADEMFDILEQGDLEEAINAANAIGDDRLQKQMQGRVVPDAFTHGTSEQRMKWFKRGYDSGDLSYGDTFSTDSEDL
ncbi:KPN_02809 family neutral zinc metallopeptidase [Marinigracilibium pacificum]|uniref:Metalloprotease n=1 Tax=Marinigracilibium pacificum TaxID=2729599 RepID=A0A848J4J2_9BACT|nr:neutral zinc metallopeptidase [Marinigracilibium pacificum]NMM50405.1 metalloprotease [Marinigracilibium pacificum]